MNGRWCPMALLLGSVAACAPADIDVRSQVVTVRTTCLGDPAELTFLVPNWDVEVPICLLDPACKAHPSALSDIPQVSGPPGVELTVWGHDDRGLEGYTARVPLGMADGLARFRQCESRDGALGLPVECEDLDAKGGSLDLFSEPCQATFTSRPIDLSDEAAP